MQILLPNQRHYATKRAAILEKQAIIFRLDIHELNSSRKCFLKIPWKDIREYHLRSLLHGFLWYFLRGWWNRIFCFWGHRSRLLSYQLKPRILFEFRILFEWTEFLHFLLLSMYAKQWIILLVEPSEFTNSRWTSMGIKLYGITNPPFCNYKKTDLRIMWKSHVRSITHYVNNCKWGKKRKTFFNRVFLNFTWIHLLQITNLTGYIKHDKMNILKSASQELAKLS